MGEVACGMVQSGWGEFSLFIPLIYLNLNE